MKFQLETAIREAKIMFPKIEVDKLIKSCEHFIDYMNGDIKRNFEI